MTGQIPFTPRRRCSSCEARGASSVTTTSAPSTSCPVSCENGVAARILLDFDADAEKIRNEIIRTRSGPGRRRQGCGAWRKSRLEALDQFGRNLTKLAAEAKSTGSSRQTEIERVMQILSRRTRTTGADR